MDWTDDQIARLRDLWAEGHSTAEIGRRMGCTKDSIVGKAHRLKLTARPSPIRPRGTGARPYQVQYRPERSMPDGAAGVRQALASARSAVRPERGSGGAPEPRPSNLHRLLTAGSTGNFGPARTCQMIEGDVRKPGWTFCGAPSEPGVSWCAAHRAVCLHRAVDRREAA